MYSSLYKIWFEESHSKEIQRLNDQILEKIGEYVKEISKLKHKTDDKIVKTIIDEELKNINFLLDDLFRLRIEKIFGTIKIDEKIDTNSLTSDEQRFYETANELYQKCSEKYLSAARGSALKESDNFFNQYVSIRILKNMNAIVGADLKTYGPFKAEDVAILPRKNAESLIQHEYAEKISINLVSFKKNE